eukprot:3620779-Amphidinium_carterae.1
MAATGSPQTPTSVVYSPAADSEMHSAAESDAAAAESPSPSMSPPSIDLGEVSPQDAFKLLTEDHAGMSPTQSTKFWQRDCMEAVYKVHALPWAECVEQHTSCLNNPTLDPELLVLPPVASLGWHPTVDPYLTGTPPGRQHFHTHLCA